MDANQIEKLKALALAATPGPWAWWTSNSTLRLTGADGKDGGVLYGYVHSGVGDVSCSEPNRAFIEESNPAAVLELIAEVERLRADAARYQHIRDTANNGYSLAGETGIGKWHVSRKMREGEGAFFFGERLDMMIDIDIAAHANVGKEPT